MAMPPVERKSVSFDIPPTIDRTVPVPPYSNEEYLEVLVRVQSVFEACSAAREKETASKVQDLQQLSAEVIGILDQLEGLPDPHHLTVLITKAVVARMGIQLYIGYNTYCACLYLRRAQPIEAEILQLAPQKGDIVPWWMDLQNSWRCFFQTSTHKLK